MTFALRMGYMFLGYKFRRQHIIGDYIVDFVCLEKMLVIEIDGEYHNEWEQQINDEERTEWLHKRGFNVIRFTNAEVIAEPTLFAQKVKSALRLLNCLNAETQHLRSALPLSSRKNYLNATQSHLNF